MSEERAGQVKKAISIVGTLLFGTKAAAKKQTEEVFDAGVEAVEQARRRRRLNGAVETTGEFVPPARRRVP
jgi:hypothetical protein